MEVGLRIFGLLIASIVIGYFTMRSAAKPVLFVGDAYELRPSTWSKISLTLSLVIALVLFVMFFRAFEDDIATKFIILWSCVFILLGVLMISLFSAKIRYDQNYLYVDGLGSSRQYDWSNLIRIREYGTVMSTGVLFLKFKGKLWVGIPTDYEGFDHFERFARRYTTY